MVSSFAGLRIERSGFEPWPGSLIVLCSCAQHKTLYSHSASLHRVALLGGRGAPSADLMLECRLYLTLPDIGTAFLCARLQLTRSGVEEERF